jgi:hypothetical protein
MGREMTTASISLKMGPIIIIDSTFYNKPYNLLLQLCFLGLISIPLTGRGSKGISALH